MPAKPKTKAPETPRPARWGNAVPSRSEQQEAKRRAVIFEAGRAFRRRGFHNVSLDEVAEALGIAKPTLYGYFRNKQEVLYECLKIAMDLGDVSVRHAAAGRTGLERIERFLRHYIEALTTEQGLGAVLSELTALEPQQRAEILGRRDRFDRQLRAWMAEGIKDGSANDTDPALSVACFMGAVNWIPAWFDPEGRKPAAEIAATFTAILTKGLAQRAG